MKQYWPLICLIAVALLAGLAIGDGMSSFMGVLFCQFALLKLFDIPGFADGFAMYDLLAQRSRAYALTYPFIELALGLAYLSGFYPPATYIVTIVVMLFGSIGVLLSLKRGLNIHCACMGTALKVPLSTVTLVEDLGMALMAFAMLMF
ncbi:MAG: hypothetical protein KDK65_00145 [Chlamydiia bacterium]|nr:hypothetical protein [Chlamydiia bacterium]